MSPVVIDSNFLVALLDAKDVWHLRAKEVESALPAKTSRLFFDIVVTEAVSVVARRCEERKRPEFFPRLMNSLRASLPPSRIVWVSALTQSYYDDAIDLMVSHSGVLNFNDCLIALFMRNNLLTFLASFDTDFDSLPYIRRISSRTEAAGLLH